MKRFKTTGRLFPPFHSDLPKQKSTNFVELNELWSNTVQETKVIGVVPSNLHFLRQYLVLYLKPLTNPPRLM